jgi:hypothetical protein
VHTTDSTDLIEIIVTATNEETEWYDREQFLCDDIGKAAEVNKTYEDLLLELCKRNRKDTFGFDYTVDEADYVSYIIIILSTPKMNNIHISYGHNFYKK